MSTLPRFAVIALAATSLSACVSAYTGPVEVTRFAAQDQAALQPGTITIAFPEEMSNERARNAFTAAIADELSAQGFNVVLDGSAPAEQVANIRTSRTPLSQDRRSRGPVSVGVGGRTGSYGSGVGLGIGINLGGGQQGPKVMSELSVRITDANGQSLWEGRAQQPVSMNSPYADVEASARTLANALFKDFPGGNGETLTIDVDELAPQ